ncbi:epithelial discoidin domain-containing receptor 1 isoform X2 [Grus americana]|uniref:epithelial discoidin domain-containing receptor 1 isoform X2 n=1 Tax=Grus americana TaxID=9117 RepID=UPI002407ED6A|nr:epithelial discoidin domain-containing receptor 1 isoform X2 [Grus americana]
MERVSRSGVTMGVLPLPLPLLLLAAGTPTSGHLDLGRCRFALGMEDGSIPDSRLSASSAWSDSTAARHGRLGRSDGDGAWCPAGPVFPEEEEFLEVDLGRLHVVTLVGTQGRHAGGHGREFAHAYRLRYSRDRHRWLRWRDRWGAEVIGGNEDPEGVVLKDLAPPPVARALRVYPRAPRAMSVCLRLELYGCPWDAGLLSYTAPQGQVMALDPAPVVLNDSTYDGYSVGPLQFGGLGQLADGVLGLDDFMRSRERRLWPGYDYVGWRRPNGPRPHVELEFEFEGLRAFRAMQVHCNNMHTRGVSIFGEVECRFKRSLATAWEPTAATHSLAGAVKDPSARSVTVLLGGRQARFIQCHFFFAGEWMLFSEITFLSDAVEEAVGASGWPPAAPPEPSAGAMAVPEDPWHGHMATNLTTLAAREPKPGQPVAKADHSHTSILIGCLVAIILLLLGVIFLILWRQYWKKILGKAQRRPSEDELRVQLSVPGDTIVINNATGAARGPPRYERIPPGEGEYQEPTRPRPSLPPAPPGPAAPLANPAYRLLLATYAQPMGGLAQAPPDGAKPINTDGAAEPEGGAGAYAEADITGGSAYAVAGPAPGPSPGPALPTFPRRRLRFREKLGEGQFGEVLLCEVEDPQALPPLSRPPDLPRGRPLLVAVKVLRPDATKNARRDFLQEARTLGRLRDPNIVRLLGVCAGPGPLCIITEYMEHGDLHQFLGGPRGPALSLATLLHVGAQIASGMRFLAGLNFVHRDLATRNCLVGDGFTVKVADFGMSRHLYAADYYRVRGRALLPIRWMAWECILMGTFTPASDAWAFGVTLWEVMTRCREQPYGRLSDEQVIANAGHHFRAQGRQEYLPCPPGCPAALHGVMLRCWSRDAADRPSFGLLHRLLRDHAGLA